MTKCVLSCETVTKQYREGPHPVEVLRGINLIVNEGEHIAIVGASGSGKSTLLNVLGGLDKPDAGTVEVLGKPFSRCNDNIRGSIRNCSMGFVYQFHHLLPEFTALENVAMPLLIGRKNKKAAYTQAAVLLEQVGLQNRSDHKPSELSGGERQRVAIARALVNSPQCVMMDEPTGNLDSTNAAGIQRLMQQLSGELATSFIVVTHDENFARTMDVVYELKNGRLQAG